MANSTDPFAESVHGKLINFMYSLLHLLFYLGTNPQFLIEKITRLKIYNCDYWKEQCFGLTSETIVDKAVALNHIGGTYGGNLKPTDFLALTLKLLQLQPEKDIVLTFIHNEDFKYLRLLGALYLRLTGKATDVYKYLEPLYNDYRKVAFRNSNGWSLTYVDEFIDSLLNSEIVCDIALPHLPKRTKLEELRLLQPRKSALDHEISSYLEQIQESVRQEASGLSASSSSLPLSSSSKNLSGNEGEVEFEEEPSQKKVKSTSTASSTSKKFDKLFKNTNSSSASSVSTKAPSLQAENTNKKVEEFSVEYWNQRRQALGLTSLK